VSLKSFLFYSVAVLTALFTGPPKSYALIANLTWNRNPESAVIGYRLYEGTISGTYTNSIDVGNATNKSVPGLTAGTTYFFAVAAYDTNGLESPFSKEVSCTVPFSNAAPVVTLTSPAANAAYTESATVPLAASVLANGNSITAVWFYDGATLLGECAASPYDFAWTNAAPGSHTLTAWASDAAGMVSSSPVIVNVTGLPAPWQTTSIGNAGTNGSATIVGCACTVTGAGNLSGSADNFQFLYQTMSGSGQIDAQILSAQNAGSSGCLGLMMRESLTSGSRYVFMGVSPGGTFDWQRRNNTSGSTSSTKSGAGTLPNVWARLTRTNGTFYGYKSTNGADWTLVASRNISMATNIYFGFAVASGVPNVPISASFTNVSAVP
jgi:chitodextrinase